MAHALTIVAGDRLRVPSGRRVAVDHLWTPALLGNMDVWLDAQDATTITLISGNVSAWNDKSGNGHNFTTGVTSERPEFKASDPVMNGYPSLFCPSGVKKHLQESGTPFDPIHAYCVCYEGDDGTNLYWTNHNALFSTTDGTHRLTGRTGGTETHWDGWRDAKNFDYQGGVYRDGDTVNIYYKNPGPNVDHLPMPAGQWKIHSDGDLSVKNWRLFNNGPSYSAWFGALGELIFTDGTEDFATEQKIEGYLAHKWGISGKLPIAHPYKNGAPLR